MNSENALAKINLKFFKNVKTQRQLIRNRKLYFGHFMSRQKMNIMQPLKKIYRKR